MKSKAVKQFDIVLVTLDPTVGSEQQGVRPCLVLLTNALAHASRTLIVAPCTTKKLERVYPHELVLNAGKETGLTEKSKVKFDQIRVIDRARVRKHLGSLPNTLHDKAREALHIIFDLQKFFA